jgi:hypothetical protein
MVVECFEKQANNAFYNAVLAASAAASMDLRDIIYFFSLRCKIGCFYNLVK